MEAELDDAPRLAVPEGPPQAQEAPLLDGGSLDPAPEPVIELGVTGGPVLALALLERLVLLLVFVEQIL